MLRPTPSTWKVAGAALVAAALRCAEPPAPPPRAIEKRKQTERIGVIGAVGGDARVKRADSNDWVRAQERMDLHPEDKLRTHKQAYATVVFEGGSSITIDEDSLVAMPTSHREGVKLVQGGADVEVVRKPPPGTAPGDFVVETPHALAKVPREIAFQ